MLTDRKNDDDTPPLKVADSGFLFGQLLVATPSVQGGCFERSVVFVSAHDASGAFGLIVNKELKNVDSKQMLETMGITLPKKFTDIPIYLGGPVDTSRGFVIHSSEYSTKNTIKYPCGVSVTSEKQVLQDYIDGTGPKQARLMMGYCGWTKDQAELELMESTWINFSGNKDIILGGNDDGKWQKVAADNGININKVLPIVGRD